MNNKIGFWSVLALVVGSQIGSGVFMTPANIAPFGIYSIWGWIISGTAAVCLAIIFGQLCERFPKTGGPHVYIEKIFGKDVAFFAGWTYWVISWVSSTAVIVASIGYLSPFIGEQNNYFYLGLEIILLLSICKLNLFGISIAGKAELLFTILKFLPLFIIPVCAIFLFDLGNFYISNEVSAQSTSTTLAQVTLLTLWGFVGVESATTPAGSVENPKKNIPRALIIGTILVALTYAFNSVSIMGLFPGNELQFSNAPYVDATKKLFSGNWYLLISISASIVCIGTLNAWVLTSGQISLGLAEDNFMPKFFAKRNKQKAPYASLIISCTGILPLLFLTASDNIASQVAQIIDFSVLSFLFIYLLCSMVNLIFCYREKKLFSSLISIFSISFCIWVISEASLSTLIISSCFTLSGLPVYFFWYKKQKALVA